MIPRLYRLLVLASVAGLVHVAAQQLRTPDPVSLADARTFFPGAARLGAPDRRLGGQTVFDAEGRRLGLALTTSPHTDDVVGYAGPSNLLIALDAERRVVGVRLLASGDTQAHVEQVRDQRSFWQQLVGWRQDEQPRPIEGVSGSTLTSLAMVEAIKRRLGADGSSLRFPEPVTLDEVKSLFPTVATLRADDPRAGWHRVLDEQRRPLGFAVRTSPYSDNGRGFRGPTETLAAIGPDRKTVVGVVLRRSYDTPEYVERVRDDEYFLKLLNGRTIEEWAELEFAKAGIEGVSGATQTSFAVADGLKRRFAADVRGREQPVGWRRWSVGLLAIVGGALAITFTPLRASRRLRTIWQGVLIVAFLFFLGDLLSLALLAGWARHGTLWRDSPAVVLLVAVALVVPWATRRQIYCQSICPHGAAQEWLSRFKRLHIRISPAAMGRLAWVRQMLLACGVAAAVFWLSFDLAWLEPFDGWVLKSAAAVSAAIAIVGLVASLFVPLAYCRFGCPTGELLARIKSGGPSERLGRRDWAAGTFVMLGALLLAWPRLTAEVGPSTSDPADPVELSGRAFGTTWSVKLRGPADASGLQAVIAAELERIESTLSHWRPESATAQFNASETTLATEQPKELIALVSQAQELSRLTSGAYDITVAPLVDAWGFGPSGSKASAPGEAEVQELLARTGWQKLEVDRAALALRKRHPQVQIDLGSLLQGYAADRVSRLLDQAGAAEFLIDVGGELLARGSWEVAIEDPRDPEHTLRHVTLSNAALATSGFYRSTQSVGSEAAHHLISPQTGRPILASAALAAVVSTSALEADGWSTALLLLGVPDGLDLAEQQGLEALMVGLNEEQHITTAGQKRFVVKSPADVPR